MKAKRPGANGNRGKTTHGAKRPGFGELTPMAFTLVLSAGKLNLPLVQSKDYVLQDNKRCYDKILSDWNFRLPSGRLDEHDSWYAILDTNFLYRHKTVLVSPWLCCIDK